ncbi:hypothetical protein [Nonomuraea phyllanthi]|uniref:hypothetical protein n=1 Tax=Nonomuraea phyllanthi TaxID=2219224 RepID=UPI00186AF3AE|nr:hypothetical protein [Nonomuraea phyllanthi]
MDEVLAEAGIKAVLTGIQMSRMKSTTERWVPSYRVVPEKISQHLGQAELVRPWPRAC